VLGGPQGDLRWTRNWTLNADFTTLSGCGPRALCVDVVVPEVLDAGGKVATPKQLVSHLIVFENVQQRDSFVDCAEAWCRCAVVRRIGTATASPPFLTQALPLGDEITFRSAEDARLAASALPRLSQGELGLVARLRVSPMAVLAVRKRLFAEAGSGIIALQDVLGVADVDAHTLRCILAFYEEAGNIRVHNLFYGSGANRGGRTA
jgi:hypothetical protein